MSTMVGKKGQVVVEKPWRDALRVEPGSIAVQKVVDDHLEIRFYPPEHDQSLAGVLSEEIKRPLPAEDWDQVRQAAWEDAAQARFAPGEDEP